MLVIVEVLATSGWVSEGQRPASNRYSKLIEYNEGQRYLQVAVGFKMRNGRDVGISFFSDREKWKKMERKGNLPKSGLFLRQPESGGG